MRHIQISTAVVVKSSFGQEPRSLGRRGGLIPPSRYAQRSTPAKVVIAGFRHVSRLSGMHAAPTLSRASETAPVSNLAASFRHRLAAVRDDNQFYRW